MWRLRSSVRITKKVIALLSEPPKLRRPSERVRPAESPAARRSSASCESTTAAAPHPHRQRYTQPDPRAPRQRYKRRMHRPIQLLKQPQEPVRRQPHEQPLVPRRGKSCRRLQTRAQEDTTLSRRHTARPPAETPTNVETYCRGNRFAASPWTASTVKTKNPPQPRS